MDPFTKVYNAIWEMAADFAPLTELVSVSNRISFSVDGNRSPVKNNIASGDLPELILMPTGGMSNLHYATGVSNVTKTFQWVLSTGDFRIHEGGLFPIEFALMRAMCNWRLVVAAVTWNGKTYVKRCDLTDLSEGESNSEQNRGIKGWSALWSCEVDMFFKTSDLRSVEGYVSTSASTSFSS